MAKRSAHNPMSRHFSLLACFLFPTLAFAAEAPVSVGWHADTLLQAIAYMVLFAVIGILLAVVGYKLFDKLTPGDLHREIIENRNVAAAVLGGAMILGVCVIIAAAMLG